MTQYIPYPRKNMIAKDRKEQCEGSGFVQRYYKSEHLNWKSKAND